MPRGGGSSTRLHDSVMHNVVVRAEICCDEWHKGKEDQMFRVGKLVLGSVRLSCRVYIRTCHAHFVHIQDTS